MRNKCNRFSILRILETDYTCYALRFFSLLTIINILIWMMEVTLELSDPGVMQ